MIDGLVVTVELWKSLCKRADVILAGACLIERVMTHLRSDAVIVSDQGVRYGLLFETLDRLK